VALTTLTDTSCPVAECPEWAGSGIAREGPA